MGPQDCRFERFFFGHVVVVVKLFISWPMNSRGFISTPLAGNVFSMPQTILYKTESFVKTHFIENNWKTKIRWLIEHITKSNEHKKWNLIRCNN